MLTLAECKANEGESLEPPRERELEPKRWRRR
jgi:hypothetical protein